MMYGYGNALGGAGGFGMLAMFVFGALIIAGVVLLVVWMARSSSGSAHASAGGAPSRAAHDEAVAIAKRRYAGGEITKEQYDELMRTLAG